MAALATPRATDVAAGARGRTARRRRRAPKGQRKAAGASARCKSPITPASYGRTLRRHTVGGVLAGRFQDQRAAPARRAERALEFYVEQVLTGHEWLIARLRLMCDTVASLDALQGALQQVHALYLDLR
jgi:hypothetical protein